MNFFHSFVVAAYEKSPYLDECLESLAAQHHRSAIIVSTSTPYPGLEDLVNRYGAKLHIHSPSRGIGADWNAGLHASQSTLVTIAHQDDVYDPSFSAHVVACHQLRPDAAFSFTDAGEIGPKGAVEAKTWNYRVKTWLIRLAFIGNATAATKWRRQVLLGFGNPIICPSVTMNMKVIAPFSFREDLRTNMDWFAWSQLSQEKPVLHVPTRLINRRVHIGSETSRCIADGSRLIEDKLMFDMIWPSPMSSIIAFIYRLSYSGYAK